MTKQKLKNTVQMYIDFCIDSKELCEANQETGYNNGQLNAYKNVLYWLNNL